MNSNGWKEGSNRTFMELKYVLRVSNRFLVYIVLIVPLWNWNLTRDHKPPAREGSNRTFMELKLDRLIKVIIQVKSSNRTFMELKSR